VIGTVVGRVAFWGVAIDPKVPVITKPEDFRGLRVVTYPSPNTIFALQKRNLVQAGLTLGKDSTIVQAQFGTELAKLFRGDADITMTLEPLVSQALENNARLVYSFADHYGEFALTGLMVTDRMVAEKPDVLQRLLNAYQKALTHAHTDPADAVSVAAEEFPDVGRSILDKAVKRMLKEQTLPREVTVGRQAYDLAASVRRDVGDLKKDVPFEEGVDNRFAKKAVEKYGPR